MNDQSVQWFFAGVAEMRAIFSFAVRGNKRPVPRMIMQTTDNMLLLQEFCRVIGISDKLWDYPPSSLVGSQKTRYMIRADGDTVYEKVIPFFDAFPMRGAKAKQYDIWREIALGLQRGEYEGADGLKRFRERWAQKSPDRPAAGRKARSK
ncbi:MAG TPA: hypothetical protein VNT01_01195 [Symbiobacteriaceae bacterium]|nr:hypothetical protein [Symbiobacteriaceae bacterium]